MITELSDLVGNTVPSMYTIAHHRYVALISSRDNLSSLKQHCLNQIMTKLVSKEHVIILDFLEKVCFL